MANVRKYTREHLQALRELAGRSLYTFQKSVLFDKDLDADFHGKLCAFLQGPGKRKGLCGFRGSLKSSSLRAWLLWMGLEEKVPDFSSMWVEQKMENAMDHHAMLQNKFKFGPQAWLLQDLYAHRIPAGFAGWTVKRTVLNRRDANSEPFCTVGSLEGKLEGGHRHAIVGDDLEGADADKSDVPAGEARKFLFERAEPLLISPSEGWIIGSGTPHGSEPLVYAIKDLADTPGTGWQMWWEPVIDADGKSKWPERFTQEWIESKQRQAAIEPSARRLWNMQYMLRRDSGATGEFDMATVRENFFTFKIGVAGNKIAKMVEYPALEPKNETGGKVTIQNVTKREALERLRITLHGDPAHKSSSQRMQSRFTSRWAWEVVGTAPDWHSFVLESWSKENSTVDEFADKFFHLYRKWCPYTVTFDPEGAQVWFLSLVKQLERTKYRPCKSLATPWRPEVRVLPRPSSKLKPFNKSKRPKEEVIIGQLQGPINYRTLHLHASQEALLHDLEYLGDPGESLDDADALSQGPPTWKPYPSEETIREQHRQEMIRKLYQMVEETTGYVRPWKEVA